MAASSQLHSLMSLCEGEDTLCETVVTCHCELPLKHSFIPPHTTFDCLAACLDTIKFLSPNEK